MFSNNNHYEEICDPGSKPTPKSFEGHIDESPLQSHVVMTQPTGLPWNIQGMPWSATEPHPTLVHFTAQSQDGTIARMKMFPSKRKADLFSPIPTKQVKTDEAMAAHLNCLHISPDFTTHCTANDTLDANDDSDAMAMNDQAIDRLKAYKPYNTLEDRLKTAERIVLCEEVRRFKSESIIPESLINKLEKPCMSLVLWKPPEKISINSDKHSDRNNNPNKSSSTRRSILISDSSEMDVEL
ncbi:mst85C [Arctopsyche grandis]|uniref:mst85C n=1 Tax=Arctopsyche grandis TaxID=121162 RepID=UPI00406D8873